MTDEEIIEIRDSLLPSQGEQFDQLAFGRAVASAEREACAKTCDAHAKHWRGMRLTANPKASELILRGYSAREDAAGDCANDIRALATP